MGYDNPDFTKHDRAYRTGGAAASGTKAYLFDNQKKKLLAAHFLITAAGTTTGAASGVTIRGGATGTNSLGACVFSTNAIGVTSSVTGIDSTVAALDIVNCLGGADATVAFEVTYEYQVLPDASFAT